MPKTHDEGGVRADVLTREGLDEKLDALAAAMPQIMADTSEESQMDAFAGIADEIRVAAGLEDAEHVWSRLQCIQHDAGLIPGDDEPCKDGEAHPPRGEASQPKANTSSNAPRSS